MRSLPLLRALRRPLRAALVLGLASGLVCAQMVQESFARDPGPLDFIRGERHEQFILQALTGDALVGLDAAGKVVPRLAARWAVLPGGIRFWLRTGLRFSDGTPVSLEDALWTFQEIQARGDASPTKRGILKGVSFRVEKEALRVDSPKPAQRLLIELARIPIAKRGRPDLGSGPFQLQSVADGWSLKARPHFLSPRIEGIHFRLIADEQGILQALRKGWLTLGVPPSRKGLQPPPTHEVHSQPIHAQLVVWSRLGVEALRHLEGWRGDAFPEGFLGSRARAARGLWPETLGFTRHSIPGKAAALSPGSRWELLFPAGDELVQKALMALRERGKRAGVDLVLRPQEAALLYDRLGKGDFQLACAPVLFDPHPWAVLEYVEPVGPMNFTKWSHPRLAAILPRLTEPDSPAWGELQATWGAGPGALPLLDFTSVLWVDRRLQIQTSPWGLYMTTPGAAGWRWKP